MALADFKLIGDFGDAAAEAKACRTSAALFDFSFLECARLEGDGARSVIESFTGRSLEMLQTGRIFYALRTAPSGESVADLTVWRTGRQSYEVMSGRREDIADLLTQARSGIDVADIGADMAVFAIQGPKSLDVLRRLGDVGPIETLRYFEFEESVLDGITCRIGRLGYTGEAGFEVIVAQEQARGLWQTLSAQARPAGFIAADMLRIEAGFVLFSNEFRVPVFPREAGLEKFRSSARIATPEITLVSFRAEATRLSLPWRPPRGLRRPTRPGEIVVTSACRSLAAGGVLGLGYVPAGAPPDAAFRDPDGRFADIRRTPLPFYDTGKVRPRRSWR